MPETNLETYYKEAREAIKDKDYDRATDLLKQILIIDENYKDASRLLADLVIEKRRRWYNDIRFWGAVIGVIVVGLMVSIAPKLLWKANIEIATITVYPTETQITIKDATPTFTPTKIPSAIPTIEPSPTNVPLVWKRIALLQELPHDRITAIVIDPGDSDVVYAGTENNGIYKSIDSGLSWRPINKGLMSSAIRSLIIDPLDSKILYISTSNKSHLYKTIDGGENWIAADNRNSEVSGNAGLLVMDPTDNQHIYFYSERHKLFSSTDKGISWSIIKPERVCPSAGNISENIVTNPLDGDTLYTAHTSDPECTAGLYKSMDGGRTWMLTSLQVQDIRSIFVEINSKGDKFLYVSQEMGDIKVLYISSDDGITWRQLPYSCSTMLRHPQGGVIGISFGVLRKTKDGGQTWETISRPKTNHVDSMAISTSNPEIIFLSGRGRLYVSKNGGVAWEERGNGLPVGRFEIENSPGDRSTLFAYPWDIWLRNYFSPLYRSGDNGRIWQLLTQTGYGLFFDADGKTIYRYGEFLQRSTNNGLNWDSLPLPKTADVDWGANRVFANPTQKGELYNIQLGGNIYRSLDGGSNWGDYSFIKAERKLDQVVLDFNREGILRYLFFTEGDYSSLDGGHTWIRCAEGAINNYPPDYHRVIDPQKDSHLIFAKIDGGLVESRDGCASWQTKKSILDSLNVNNLVIDPNNPETVYAGTDGGAFISYDFGQTWGEINNGLLGVTVIYSIVVDSDSNVYAATPYGIFKLESK